MGVEVDDVAVEAREVCVVVVKAVVKLVEVALVAVDFLDFQEVVARAAVARAEEERVEALALVGLAVDCSVEVEKVAAASAASSGEEVTEEADSEVDLGNLASRRPTTRRTDPLPRGLGSMKGRTRR